MISVNYLYHDLIFVQLADALVLRIDGKLPLKRGEIGEVDEKKRDEDKEPPADDRVSERNIGERREKERSNSRVK